ncbi:hypothetical protein RhiirC2_790868 [Rhizophagus irregularis]|uniref:Uncharacterized protein n=1 Tax=Rhizophagus irregularis TaxID=588596 RepID=A0A2N1MKD4_9GLOM|nr:hypothetical protein RhiirC2_790868 [Rhizophagus irregularis]
MEAKHQIINEESLISIKEKVNKEQSSCYIKDLEYYWKEVITELNKDSVKQKHEKEKENFNLQSKNELNKKFNIIVNPKRTKASKWIANIEQCSLDNERKPNFKLSKPVVIIYGNEDMEDRVKKVLGYIVWLLEEAQRLDELEDKK